VHVVLAWSQERKGPAPVEEQVRFYLRDLVVWHAVAETIGERHFAGYDVLLSEPRTALGDLKRFAEEELLRFNDQLDWLVWRKKERRQRGPKLPVPIDWETLRAEFQDETARRVRELVDVARAEACDMMGEEKRAQAFRERHL
jgi:hypothetical protein